MIFKDRSDAGMKLASQMENYRKDDQTIVLAIPRGGIEVAFNFCCELSLPMEITVAKKIQAPFDSELAIGAVSEEGDVVLNNSIIESLGVSKEEIELESKKGQEEIKRRLKSYRKERELVNLSGKKVIIIDDGIATGATIKAVIKLVKRKKAKKVIVAVPVAPLENIKELEKECDEVISLLKPEFFESVGTYYYNFEQLSDEKIEKLITKDENFN